jgi:hypothetical protein
MRWNNKAKRGRKMSASDNEGNLCALPAATRRDLRGEVGSQLRVNRFSCARAIALIAGVLSIGISGKLCHAAVLPASTAIPVQFTRTLDAGKAKPGDAVVAKTMQIILLSNGQVLPKGASVMGHVVASRPFTFDPTPYAVQQPSYLSIHFDKINAKSLETPLNVYVRALADTFESSDASYPHRLGDSDSGLGTMDQIGGDHYSPIGKRLLTSEDDVVGYVRKHGVFARLISNEYVDQYASFRCDSTAQEQSVSIFSPSACGLYGFDSTYMPDNGMKSGNFRLESRHHTVKLSAGSAALLEVNGPQP